jgi:hypothetical protein
MLGAGAGAGCAIGAAVGRGGSSSDRAAFETRRTAPERRLASNVTAGFFK